MVAVGVYSSHLSSEEPPTGEEMIGSMKPEHLWITVKLMLGCTLHRLCSDRVSVVRS